METIGEISAGREMPRRRQPLLTRRTLLASALVCASGLAKAEQSYPSKPITMLIPFPPGTGNDVVGRIVGKKVSEYLGQPVIADNRAGAFGNIAVDITRRATPDGYTVIVASSSFSINRWTMLSATYSVGDFTPIALIGKQPYSLMVTKSTPAKDIRELVDLIKKKPGEYNGAQGSGTGYFLLSVLKKTAGIDLESVAYKGTTEAVMDLVAGRVQLLFAPITTSLPYYGTGEVRIFGVSGSERSRLMPDVPTFTESGFAALDIPTWFAMLGPKGIASGDVKVLSGAVAKALTLTEVTDPLAKNGIAADYGSPADLEAFLNDDMARWSDIVKASGFKPT
jgi:tripartite-type tricarboxylate transporter receptor subunit TctC